MQFPPFLYKKITDHNGNVEIMQFNDLGNTVSIQDDEGHAQFAQFAKNTAEDTGKGNQLKVASKLQNTVGNRLKHSSFESGSGWYTNNTALAATRSTEAAYLGNYSMKLVSSATSTVAALVDGFNVAPGETYTFSAYVKTESAYAIIALQYGADYTTYMGSHLSPNKDWTRLQVSYTNTASETRKITPILFLTTAGTAYMDNVQVEKSSMPSRFNLIDNGDFVSTGTSQAAWTRESTLASTDAVISASAAAATLNSNVYSITGSPTSIKRVSQNVTVKGSAGDSYVFAAWAKGNSAPLDYDEDRDREFAVRAKFNYTDGTSSDYFTAQFNPDSNAWQYAAGAMVAKQAYSSIQVQLVYDYNVNTVCFDGAQLYKEQFGSSYTYDDKGNVISVKDLQAQTTTYEYANNDLTKIIQNDKAKMTYTYDSYHNVKTATTEEKLTYTFAYDTYGNNTSVSIGSGTTKITSSATYSNSGNTLASTTDALGKTTLYSYNANTNVLEWVQYPEDVGTTRKTQYSYDEMYRMATAAATTNTGLSMSASYTYTGDLLTEIKTPTTAYSFEYGTFGLRKSVSIGSRVLATYDYTDNQNYYLEKLDYGNQDSVEYEYDDKGRVTTQTYEDGDTVTYTYDNNGALAKVKDSETGITTTYYYDLTDRLAKYTESGGDYRVTVSYKYDTLGNVTSVSETLNDKWRGTYYTYDDDNRVTRMYRGRSARAYTYDAYGRITGKTAQLDGSSRLTDSYAYAAPTTSTTSAQIASHTVAANGINKTYSYTYDDNGNILTISDGTNTVSYTYDSANQLTQEDNPAGGYRYFWIYDSAGNIKWREEYTYVEGQTEPVYSDTVAYTYGDSTWKDLLTYYNGKTITYDGIGNPLSDGTWTYTWEHGRELASMTQGATTWTYTYDANGLRTSRSNGTDTYSYMYVDGQLMWLSKGSEELRFVYDAEGVPLSVLHNDSTYYFYVTNVQGDVIAMLDNTGAKVVEYSYDAWGNILSVTGSMADTIGALNPLRYRGYVYDTETELYYLQSRYYNPEMGRFINADNYPATGQGLLGNNMFAYCQNKPTINKDTSGEAIETVWDIISLGASIAEVAINPADPWAWIGLIGDVADVAIPCVGGLGEAVRALKAVNAIDETVDMVKITKNTLETIATVAHATSMVGNSSVYTSYHSNPADTLEYVGITNDFERRRNEWKKVRKIEEYVTGVDRKTARYVEQSVITLFGRGGSDGLSNIRNSIGRKGKLFDDYLDFMRKFF